MCGVLASADKAALDAGNQEASDRAGGSGLRIGRKTGSALRALSNTEFRKPATVVISLMSAALLVCTMSYFTLRSRSAEKTPAAPSLGATSSEPNIKSASAPLHGSDESPAEDANSRSAKPGPERISKTETETKDDSPTELWNRVRHGNTEAEVALAKLYLQGTALERSCEQAHQLLLAASRKRSKAADSLLAGAYAQQCQ